MAHLYHKYRIHVGIMLLRSILIPTLTLFQPFFHRRFQKHDVVILGRILGVGDYNTILQQARSTHLVGSDHIFHQSYIGGVANQGIESLCCCTDTQNYRHRTHGAFHAIFCVGISLDEALHNGGVGTSLSFALGTSMRFVNDEVQVIRLVLDGVIQCFPDGILPIVRVLCQLTAAADLLGV